MRRGLTLSVANVDRRIGRPKRSTVRTACTHVAYLLVKRQCPVAWWGFEADLRC